MSESESEDGKTIKKNLTDGDSLIIGVFPPVEERSGPEGAEEEEDSKHYADSSENEEEEKETENEKNDTLGSFTHLSSSLVLPWGAHKERTRFPTSLIIDVDIKPGEFVMRTLFAEFTVQVERKIESVMSEPLERPLSKSLTRGEDPIFDQLLSAFGSVAEHTLPSLLRTLFEWYERQSVEWIVSESKGKGDSRGKSDLIGVRLDSELLGEKRDLSIEFIFCLVLIEVLKTLSVHPGHEDLVQYVETLAFKHFNYRDSQYLGPNAVNIHMISDLYAEVLGVLAQSRFMSTKKKFFSELRDLRAKEPSPLTTQSIISLLMGMKFFRVKMVPFEDFELSLQFMLECAQYFIEVKDKDIKHAVAGLFVEILVPVAAAVKNEVNVPVLKKFVETLYAPTLDMCTRSKHRLAIFPLVTCLLCVSQKSFFLHNWHYFLTMCLQHFKSRDSKMERVALESLYRLLWVYMIRIKCESNNMTQSRLQSIVNSLFPKGSKAVVPRQSPLNIFVKIIQFIAQEKLEFAMREIVFDLLSVGRPIKVINAPERMSIGLRAFLVVADALQQKEGDPPMPRTIGIMPSGSTLRVKKTWLNKMLSEETAKTIGLSSYIPYVRKVFDELLRACDAQFGKPYLLSNTTSSGKTEGGEESKTKFDLFKTVVAAIPRLIPDGMSRSDLVETLSRLSIHTDEELRGLACQALQNLVIDFLEWREEVVHGFLTFIVKDIPDTIPNLLDNALRMLLQLLVAWKNALDKNENGNTPHGNSTTEFGALRNERSSDVSSTLHSLEGLCLVMFCHSRLPPRRLSHHILREVKGLFNVLGILKDKRTVLEALDEFSFSVVEENSGLLPLSDKSSFNFCESIDFSWFVEKSSYQWTAGFNDEGIALRSGSSLHLFASDPWSISLSAFLSPDRLPRECPSALLSSWPIVYTRLSSLFSVVDPAPLTDNRASLLRPGTGPKKPLNEKDLSMHLWKNYIAFACRVVPPNQSSNTRAVSPDIFLSSSSPDRDKDSSFFSPSLLYKLLVPLLRSEVPDMREALVQGLGRINPSVLLDLISEMMPLMKEANDRKQESMRRRRRRDVLRLQLFRVFELIASQGTFSKALYGVTDGEFGSLSGSLSEYIDGAASSLESENDKYVPSIRELKMSFSSFIRKLIASFSLERRKNLIKKDVRKNLFYLFAGWSGKVSQAFQSPQKSFFNTNADFIATEFEFSSLQSMISVLCCGPCFDESLFGEDGPLYQFLDILLESNDSKVYKLAQETIVLLLEFNSNTSNLLEWVVDRCFTGNASVADCCFLALATIFGTREYPCDHYTAIINVSLLKSGCPRTHIHETGVQLLQILDHRFFGSVSHLSVPHGESHLKEEKGKTLDFLLSNSYSRSQLYLSKQLAQLHPELTMAMFSEICHRLQTALSSVRQNMLSYLLPWLHNMELVDPNVLSSTSEEGRQDGWGSAEATEMITNNLFYITAKFGDDLPKEVEECWGALISCWPNNLKIIIRYLIIVCGMATSELIEYAKRVLLYLGRSQPITTLEQIMNELQTVESLNCVIERTEVQPYYRLTCQKKDFSNSDFETHWSSSRQDLCVEKGTIHTKRHSQEEYTTSKDVGIAKNETLSLSGSLKSAGSIASSAGSAMVAGIQRVGEKVRALSGSSSTAVKAVIEAPGPSSSYSNEVPTLKQISRSNTSSLSRNPLRPLPMPEYGGWFAPLTEFLPEASQAIVNFHRCNLAAILLTDLIVDGLDFNSSFIDWSAHLPLMLHIVFLGLDNSRSIVHKHCQQLLLNLLIVLGNHNDHLSVSRILLTNKTKQLGFGLEIQDLDVMTTDFMEDGNNDDILNEMTEEVVVKKMMTNPKKIQETDKDDDDDDQENIEECIDDEIFVGKLTKSLIYFVASRSKPFWQYEDITRTVWTIPSAEHIDKFLQKILFVFEKSFSANIHLAERWSLLSLQLALSVSSRHYAGRSLQIFRALRVPISSRSLSDILSRLVETIAETGEDMQGYVTELILTLESVVDALDSDFRPLDELTKEIFKSTPNLKEEKKSVRRGPSSRGEGPPIYHARSTSYSASVKPPPSSPIHGTSDNERNKSGLSRSRSAQSLRSGDQGSTDEKMNTLVQLFWICLAILESDYEHEFLLGLRLLRKVMSKLPLDRPDVREKIEKLQRSLKWNSFPGLHSLLLKGLTHPTTYELTIQSLSRFTLLLDFSVIDPSNNNVSFPMNVIALLPYMIQNYEDANELCIRSAENIATNCNKNSTKLANLATVMTLYSRRTFSKESFQWTKCVVKYLYDAYSHFSINMLGFLVEVLEKGPSSIQAPILNIIHCLLHYVDMSSATTTINADLLRAVAKFIETQHWKESLKILKLAVTRSSSLVAPTSSTTSSYHWEAVQGAFSEADLYFKKELPGRTMEFTFDLSQTPVVGRRSLPISTIIPPSSLNTPLFGSSSVSSYFSVFGVGGTVKNPSSVTSEEKVTPPSTFVGTPRRSVSTVNSADSFSSFSWKRPWLCQSRVRERLVNILNSCGQRVGLPKSPSVIFSQTSEILERVSSMASSTEEVSNEDSKQHDTTDTEQKFCIYMKEFDFLEYELESLGGESVDNFNWGARRPSLSQLDDDEFMGESYSEPPPHRASNPQGGDESSDDELASVCPSLDDEIISGRSLEDQSGASSSVSTTSSELYLPLDDKGCRKIRSPTPQTTESEEDDTDHDVTPCNPSPSLLHWNERNNNSEENNWKNLVQKIMGNPSNETLLMTFVLFSKLFSDLKVRTCVLSQESFVYLSNDKPVFSKDLIKMAGLQLQTLTDILSELTRYPFVWCSLQNLGGLRLIERVKFNILELQENLENFIDKRELTLECLDALRVHHKLKSLGEHLSDYKLDSEQLDLTRCLYKLHFQLLLLLESFVKLLRLIHTSRVDVSEGDESKALASLQSELTFAALTTERNPKDPETCENENFDDSLSCRSSTSTTNRTITHNNNVSVTDIRNELLELLKDSQWNEAMRLYRLHRNDLVSLRDFPVGVSDEEDVAHILNIYCDFLFQQKSSLFVMTVKDGDLAQICGHWMDASVQLLGTVKAMESEVLRNTQSNSSL